MCGRTLPGDSSSACSRTGARRFPVIIFTIQAVANHRRHSRCWSTHFDIAGDDEPLRPAAAAAADKVRERHPKQFSACYRGDPTGKSLRFIRRD
jgi:hypothetical protein